MSDFSEWIAKNRAIWTRVYDEVIAPDIQKEWEQRDEAHKNELKQKEENQQILFNHVESQVIKNSRLDSENEKLRQQLDYLSKDVAVTSDVPPGLEQPMLASSHVSTNEHGQLVLRYDELSKKYRDLSQKIKYLERKNTAVMQKNKDMKESVRAWQEYADRQSGKQKPKSEARSVDDRPRLSAVSLMEYARPHTPSSPRSVATSHTPPSCADAGRSSPAPMPPLASTETVDLDKLLSPSHHVVDEEEESPTDVSSNIEKAASVGGRLQAYLRTNPSSSQTTEDESTQQATRSTTLTTATHDDDDVPQFVSARSLKRKRSQHPKLNICGHPSSDGTPIKPFRVKEEPVSSQPHAHSLFRKDTIDLDDPTSTLLKTPRHTRHNVETMSSMINAYPHARSTSAPFSQTVKQEHSVLESTNSTSDVTVQADEPGFMDAEVRARSEPSNQNQIALNVLRLLKQNTLAVPQAETSSKRIKRAEARSKGGYSAFAESGEDQPLYDENAGRLPPSVARAKINHNRQSPPMEAVDDWPISPITARVKTEPSPASRGSSRPIQTPQARTRLHPPQSSANTTVRDESTTDGRPQWKMKAQQPRQSARKIPNTRQIDKGPLRQKPPTELTLHDFKPNPEYNQGYTYAFSETIRKRGDRMCLPGCTNPECCGSTFRTFAQAMAPLPLSQEETLLEEYLGEAYDNMRLTQMSPEERKELVLQARTRKLAKETGKHRETYERRRTPPGFWRVDFPTTQEQQEDREEADEQERQVLQDRWLEAQRKGGRWIFRDE
ncbi:DNA repair protein endonuclease SAE2/CtIP C-terminus-domain-containing protein [Phaeosphaeria sp. MPI-PUGE-AT-0046c]|nr:DNA repair protein endonuclease SAE2/CtIP C-terminus-domain-containing protein [Phaeosphaeria sp. MPI-PUGE-AT-0046c]